MRRNLNCRMKKNECARRRGQHRVGEQNCDPSDKIMISRLGSEVKHSHLADCAALRDPFYGESRSCGLIEGAFFGARLPLESRAQPVRGGTTAPKYVPARLLY
jgi:hypothetical protein